MMHVALLLLLALVWLAMLVARVRGRSRPTSLYPELARARSRRSTSSRAR